MTQREKLIDLLIDSSCCPKETDCEDCEYRENAACREEMIADYLLANGVQIPCLCMDCGCGTDDGTGIYCDKHEKQFGDYDYCSYGERKKRKV